MEKVSTESLVVELQEKFSMQYKVVIAKKKLIIYLSLGTSVNYIICHVRADEPPQIITVILMTMYELNLLRWTVVLLK